MTEPAGKRRWSRHELRQARERVRAALREPEEASLEGLESVAPAPPASPKPEMLFEGPICRAAAVRSRFRIDDLRGLGSPAEADALVLASIMLREQSGAGWRSLTPDVRNQLLAKMTVPELRSLLAEQKVEDDPLQKAIGAALDGLTPETLRGMSTGALAALLQVHEGLSKTLPTLPSRDQIERKLQLVRIIEPLQEITRTFSGRETELQTLRDYVGVLPAGNWFLERVRFIDGLLGSVLGWTPKDPFLIFGPGGVGKTTLVSMFILEHALEAQKQSFPFAYIDFDRSTVVAEQVATILIETVRQIGLQYDAAYESSMAIQERWQKRLTTGTDATTYVRDFATFLETLEVRDSPVLMVLDTFEEVQRRSDAYAAGVVKLVKRLTKDVPRLRVVIAGRSPVKDVEFADTLELSLFDEPSAIAYLMNNGLDPESARLVAGMTKGHPLTLTLAIELYRRDPEDLRQLDPAKLVDGISQSFLFDRIMLHIEDPAVRRLAHPGLIVRRVTPEVIWHVLAKPCGVDVPDKVRAEELFDRLAADSTLVTRVERWVLVHRSDVRRLMLGPLLAHEPQKVKEIHRAAIEFYRDKPDAISRAELAYHSLSLGPPFEIELADDLEPLLVNAMEELPLTAQAKLADRYKLALREEAVVAADQETWERIAIQRVKELLGTGELEGAARVFAERPLRSDATELMAYEATFLTLRGDREGARRLAAEGIARYRAKGNNPALFHMLCVAAENERESANFDAAYSYLVDAEDIARRRGDPRMLARALNNKAWVMETEGETPDDELRSELATATRAVSDETWSRDLGTLRSIVAQVALIDRSIVPRALHLGALVLRRSDEEYLVRPAGVPPDLVMKRLAEDPHPELVRALVDILRRERVTTQSTGNSPATRTIRPTSSQRTKLRDLLVQHYGHRLASFVESRYGRTLEAISFAAPTDTPKSAEDLVRSAEREGWINELIVGLARSRFTSLDVLLFIDSLGLGPALHVPSGKDAAPEKRLRALLHDYRVSVSALETRTCIIDDSLEQTGCGFLAGRSTIATVPATLKGEYPGLLFDRVTIKGKTVDGGNRMTVSRRPVDDITPAITFFQINAVLADHSIDLTGAPDAPNRGAVELPASATIDPRAPIFWLCRTMTGTRISGATKIAETLPDGRAIIDVASTTADRGAPCFDAALNVIGIHCGPSPVHAKQSVIAPASSPSAP